MDNTSNLTNQNNLIDELIHNDKIIDANAKAIDILQNATAKLVKMAPAIEAIPGMTSDTILHAGPPIEFGEMCGAMRGSVVGALIIEGMAKNEDEAISIAGSGKIRFCPGHQFGAVNVMSGIISANMPVFVVKNEKHNNYSYSCIHEGGGRALQHGAYDKDTIDRLHYFTDDFQPLLANYLSEYGGIDLNAIIAKALHMGDECHNRSNAATLLFLAELFPKFIFNSNKTQAAKAIDFISNNDSFFLPLAMAACKCMLDATIDIPYSTIVNAMSRNGVSFGIRLCSLGKDNWFTGPSQHIMGVMEPGFAFNDGNKDMGDSCITETLGMGGFAMSAAPAIIKSIGGTAEDAIHCSRRMYEITTSQNPAFTVPADNFKGLPLGIDILKIIKKRILPIINTSIAHKNPGVGQIGTGIVTPPFECFEKAYDEFILKYAKSL
jgi:hypothetical protein